MQEQFSVDRKSPPSPSSSTIIYDRLAEMMLELPVGGGLFESPFWFVAEGAIVGLFIGYFATRYGGEGPATVRPTRM